MQMPQANPPNIPRSLRAICLTQLSRTWLKVECFGGNSEPRILMPSATMTFTRYSSNTRLISQTHFRAISITQRRSAISIPCSLQLVSRPTASGFDRSGPFIQGNQDCERQSSSVELHFHQNQSRGKLIFQWQHNEAR